jgi:hypothetical protein
MPEAQDKKETAPPFRRKPRDRLRMELSRASRVLVRHGAGEERGSRLLLASFVSRSTKGVGERELTHTKIETELAGRTLTLETGKWAKLADAAVVATLRRHDRCSSTAQSGPEREGIDFFPLVRSTTARRPTLRASSPAASSSAKHVRRTREIADLPHDRPARCGRCSRTASSDEVQVMSQVLSTTRMNDSDVVARWRAFAAVCDQLAAPTAPIGAMPHRLRERQARRQPERGRGERAARASLERSRWRPRTTTPSRWSRPAETNGVSEEVMLEALEARSRGHQP